MWWRGRCVEIGCGSGYVLTSAARIIIARGGACRFIGTDISDSALAATRSTLEAHKVQSKRLSSTSVVRCPDQAAAASVVAHMLTIKLYFAVQVHAEIELVKADLLGPLLPRLQQQVDLLVSTGAARNSGQLFTHDSCGIRLASVSVNRLRHTAVQPSVRADAGRGGDTGRHRRQLGRRHARPPGH